MYPQLNFASVCKRDMRKDGKLLSFKAKSYRSGEEGQHFGGKRSLREVLDTIFLCSLGAQNC